MKDGYFQGLGVIVKDNNIELALKKFKKKIKQSGILIEYKDNMHFEKPSMTKKRKKMFSILRAKKLQEKQNN
jgi:small subunit ribosomal protein S21